MVYYNLLLQPTGLPVPGRTTRVPGTGKITRYTGAVYGSVATVLHCTAHSTRVQVKHLLLVSKGRCFYFRMMSVACNQVWVSLKTRKVFFSGASACHRLSLCFLVSLANPKTGVCLCVNTACLLLTCAGTRSVRLQKTNLRMSQKSDASENEESCFWFVNLPEMMQKMLRCSDNTHFNKVHNNFTTTDHDNTVLEEN